jgi:hypothetical protein
MQQAKHMICEYVGLYTEAEGTLATKPVYTYWLYQEPGRTSRRQK